MPLTFSVKLALPAITGVGDMLVAVGSGLFTGSETWLEVPPPGAGENTSMVCEPASEISAGVTEMRSWVAPT